MNKTSYTASAIQDQDKYIIELPDYSAPALISGAPKEYVGTKEEINRIKREAGTVTSKKVRVLAENGYRQTNVEMEFINTYGFDHSIKADELKTSVLYLKNGKRYMRCIKAKIKNMAIGIHKQDYYHPEAPMGNPDVVYVDGNMMCSRLYTVERVFKNRQEYLYDVSYPSKIDFRCFLLDIFGDG